MSELLFISDLHLTPEREQTNQLFFDFMQRRAPQADALYILGDFFEVWLGDDDRSVFNQQIITALRQLVDTGTPIYFMHGNRDFLIADEFATQSGCQLLPDPYKLDCYGTPTLLSHGDALCTDDVEHQQFRAQVHNPEWQQTMLALPLTQRQALAKQYRMVSQENNQLKSMEIMDVNANEIIRIMRQHNVQQLIHGHTHRPAIHEFMLDKKPAKRLVLGDWYQAGNALTYQSDSVKLEHFQCL